MAAMKPPKTAGDIGSFLGSANFYGRFIMDYAAQITRDLEAEEYQPEYGAMQGGGQDAEDGRTILARNGLLTYCIMM